MFEITFNLTLFYYLFIIKGNLLKNKNFVLSYNIFYSNSTKIENNIQGPHLLPKPLKTPEKLYMPNLDKNRIGVENKNYSLIYQWINLLNGKTYIGSAIKGSSRLLAYWTPSVLNRNFPIYKSIIYYGHNNFCLAILEYLGKSGTIKKSELLKREQFYLDILFKNYYDLALNLSPTAGNNLGYKHTELWKEKRRGKGNPLYGKPFSTEFLIQQKVNREGPNNPMFGVTKSPETIAKLQKWIYVYDYDTKEFLGSYTTVECSKKFKMGKDTLTKYLASGLPFKNKLFSRVKLF